jgi:hypothetical protein
MDRTSTPRRPGDSTGNAFRLGALAHKRQIDRERKLAEREAQELADSIDTRFDPTQGDHCGRCGGLANECECY